MRTVCKVTLVGVALLGAAGVAIGATAPAPAPLAALASGSNFIPAPAASADAPGIPYDFDAPRGELTARNAPAEMPVEAIPTPTAVSSGLVALAALAGYRLIRGLRLA